MRNYADLAELNPEWRQLECSAPNDRLPVFGFLDFRFKHLDIWMLFQRIVYSCFSERILCYTTALRP